MVSKTTLQTVIDDKALHTGLKSRFLEEYGIHVWDMANLLWLFDANEDIKKQRILPTEF